MDRNKLFEAYASANRLLPGCPRMREVEFGNNVSYQRKYNRRRKELFLQKGHNRGDVGFSSCKSSPIWEDLQRSLAEQSNTLITSIPSGLARYWRTLPRHFARVYPDKGAPIYPDKAAPRKMEKEEQQKWLEIVRTEMLSALETPENTLLEAYMAAYPRQLRALLGKKVIKENDCPRA
jgi:hypothetical protein